MLTSAFASLEDYSAVSATEGFQDPPLKPPERQQRVEACSRRGRLGWIMVAPGSAW